MNFEKLIRYEKTDRPFIKHGQGCVWQAKDLLFDRLVAINQVRADLNRDKAVIRQFKKEAAAGARLGEHCENIVSVFDYGCVDEDMYFVMEWIDGGNLEHKCGCLTLENAKGIMRQISNGVATAHDNGLVHSDIAPANILFDTTRGTCKLSDFGYLKIVDSMLISRGSGPLHAGGRPDYMPTEHWLNPSKINKSTDVYALAVTFHNLIVGSSLRKSGSGSLIVDRPIFIKYEQKPAPDEVRKLLTRFIEARTDSDSVSEFRKMLDRIP